MLIQVVSLNGHNYLIALVALYVFISISNVLSHLFSESWRLVKLLVFERQIKDMSDNFY